MGHKMIPLSKQANDNSEQVKCCSTETVCKCCKFQSEKYVSGNFQNDETLLQLCEIDKEKMEAMCYKRIFRYDQFWRISTL